MPKMMTTKAAAKRFSMTATGKYKRKRANLRHNLEKKSPGQKKRAGKVDFVSPADVGLIKRMLPNG